MSNIVAANRLFIVSSLKRYAGFYQQLITGVSSFSKLGSKLVSEAETALAFRQTEKLEELASILSNIPIKEYQLIGQYYLGLSAYRNGQDAHRIFENVLEHSHTFKVRAMLSFAAVEARYDNHEEELRYFAEAAKYADSVTSIVKAYRGIATVKAKEGFHRASLKDLEALLPLAQLSEPIVYYDYLNSYATELGEAGRKEEARNICQVVLASPFAFAYPEWQATAEDLRGANRSSVVIQPGRARPKNVLALPLPDRDGIEFPAWAGQPGQVINYEQRKNRMAKKKNGDKRKPLDEMSEKDLFLEIINLFSSDKLTYEQRVKILQYTEKLLAEPDDDKPGA